MASGQMTLIVFFAIIAALYFARDVLIPLTLAVLLSILLAPLVGLLRGLRLGRIPAVLLAVLTAVGLILAIGGLIGTQIADLADNVPTYAQTIESKAGTMRGYAMGQIGRIATRLGYDDIVGKKPAKPAAAPAPMLPRLPTKAGPQPLPVEVHQPDPSPLELAERYLSPILSPLGTVGIVFVVAIFILLQQDDLRDRLIRLFGSSDLRRTTVALDDGGRRLSRYFLTQLGINTAFGIIIATGLFLIGIPSPLLWGVLGGLLRFVPYVGAIIAALFPMALAAAVDPGWSMVLWAGGLFIVVEAIVGQLIEPLLYGHSTGLSPISVVVAAIFWSWLWGPIGLILSTPLTLCLVVLGRHVDQLEFLDVMLGDRPALTPVESFYQRMLAGDQDEARDHAELLLKERSLTSYYDDVALPGLELAAVDAQRGALSAEQLERIRDTISELVEDLAGHLDKQPVVDRTEEAAGPARDQPVLSNARPPETLGPAEGLSAVWRGPAPVLCVAGRGLLDEAVATMLCQLLSKHGIGARIAPYEAATRGNINLLETSQVAMVCVSYLDISGKHAHLRYLLQRLRQRMPTTPIVVGLWPSEDPSMPDPTLRDEIGADYYTRTLHQAVEICVRVARMSETIRERVEA
ncbi:MAG: family transporter [Rhodospirillales bacterium]|nr:family transporter [Rhodospirillales bacterium]